MNESKRAITIGVAAIVAVSVFLWLTNQPTSLQSSPPPIEEVQKMARYTIYPLRMAAENETVFTFKLSYEANTLNYQYGYIVFTDLDTGYLVAIPFENLLRVIDRGETAK